MKQTWNSLASRNSMHYIATDKNQWDVDSFFRIGNQRLHMLLSRMGVTSSDCKGRIVDLGCGIGRFTFTFAQMSDYVLGVDISDEMIQKANILKMERGYTNVEFYCNNGSDLSFIPTESCDFAFSYTVLQHIPDKSIVFHYIKELARIVRPGGKVLFQVLTYQERPLAQFARLGLPSLYRVLWQAERLGLVPPEQGVAFHGSRLTIREVELSVPASGLAITFTDRQHGAHTFCDETTILCQKPSG
jgi:2-polyprenyl-3-methyl-5-hydroxy-6-metoxy-1,4-benzoquinol methylase